MSAAVCCRVYWGSLGGRYDMCSHAWAHSRFRLVAHGSTKHHCSCMVQERGPLHDVRSINSDCQFSGKHTLHMVVD
jgi:hypothetical protein